MELYSAFENTFFDATNVVSPVMKWQTQVHYFKGDLSDVDVTKDWRFCVVPKKRQQAIFLGLVMKEFPPQI